MIKKDSQIESANDEDDMLREMTASYSEISINSQSSPDIEISSNIGMSCFKNVNERKVADTRPDQLELKDPDEQYKLLGDYSQRNYQKTLDYLQSEGTVMKDGDLVLFVAEDLENKIKLSSPSGKKTDYTFIGVDKENPYVYKQTKMMQSSTLDPNILNELENEARKIATSVDCITENLAAILHSASALTVGCLETYRDAVCKTCDTVDYNIKAMYQLMAKCEELSKSMASVHKMSEKIKEMKKMLDLFENVTNY